MKSFFFWIVPPLAGAFIGYVTNALAIKMLFRPLGEIRLFGLRIPFTPGILPRERHKLADSIGRMVERELLTPGVLRQRFASAEVREHLGNALGSYSGTVLERPLAHWFPVPPGHSAGISRGASHPKADEFPLAEILGDFFNSGVFDFFLEEIIRTWAGRKNPPSCEDENSLGSWIKSRFRDIGGMFVPAARDFIKSGLAREIKNHARGEPSSFGTAMENLIEKYPGLTLGEFLCIGPPKKRRLDSFFAEKTAAALDENIEAVLSSVDVRLLVSERINSMDMLRVEKIVLDVMAGQLKWINVFGAIVGALIGFLQVVLSYIQR